MAQATGSVNYLNETNVKAFLKLIRYCEHHRREDDGVYYVLYGGGHFTDTSTHPMPKGKEIRDSHHKRHTPSGAFQITYDTWERLKKQGVVNGFSPHEQDIAALYIIKEFHALENIRKGDIQTAISKLRSQWAAFPGACQEQIEMDEAVNVFNRFVKEYSKK